MSGLPSRIRRRLGRESGTLATESQAPALPVILTIDDEPHHVETLKMILKPGFRVVSAGSVDEGMEVFQKERPDTVIMDVRMPGKDGLQGLEEIRQIDPLISVILLTAYADLDIARHAIRLGANEFMTKPYDIFELHRSVQKCVEQSWRRRRHVAGLKGMPKPNTTSSDSANAGLPNKSTCKRPSTYFDPSNFVLAVIELDQRVQGSILSINESRVICQVQAPDMEIHKGDAYSDFHVVLGNRTAYRGKAKAHHVMPTDLGAIVEFSLGTSWFQIVEAEDSSVTPRAATLLPDVQQARQALRNIGYSFKVVVVDILTLLQDIRDQLESAEMELRQTPEKERLDVEQALLKQTQEDMIPALNSLFQEFEAVAHWVPDEAFDLHLAYVQKHLHPFLICSPFIHRVHAKPLGFPGDYEMLNKLLDHPHEGHSLFAKMINTWIIGTPAGEAYRYRIDLLTRITADEIDLHKDEPCRLFSLGCGAAREVQNLISASDTSLDHAKFTLVDFNQPTLDHCQETLNTLGAKHGSSIEARYVKLSVQQVLSIAWRTTSENLLGESQYDVIYCAGLFDYLSDRMCTRLLRLFYDMLAPGGRIVVSNFNDANPIRHFMSYLLEWHLIHRNRRQLHELLPKNIRDTAEVLDGASPGGIENYLDIRKPLA